VHQSVDAIVSKQYLCQEMSEMQVKLLARVTELDEENKSQLERYREIFDPQLALTLFNLGEEHSLLKNGLNECSDGVSLVSRQVKYLEGQFQGFRLSMTDIKQQMSIMCNALSMLNGMVTSIRDNLKV